ncbi:MAG: type I restriction-modification enzyme R subunit C-terminal domain-containing protein [bacterium]|nr:type I restriction-modification enzyme R subunit C-terminal domain-containing protein [bacterium]
MASTSFWSADGKPVSAAEFLDGLFGTLPDFFKNEAELRALWGKPDSRKQLLDQLSEKGYDSGQLKEIAKLISAEKSDVFDVLAYIAFALSPITREERATSHRKQILALFNEKQQIFIDFVLSQYVAEGVEELNPEKLPDLLNIKYKGLEGAKQELGEIKSIREIFVGFQGYLYEVA